MRKNAPKEAPRISYHDEMKAQLKRAKRMYEEAAADVKNAKNDKEWFAKVSAMNAASVDVETAKSRIENYNTGKHVPEIYVMPSK